MTGSEAQESVNNDRAIRKTLSIAVCQPPTLGSGLYVQGRVEGHDAQLLIDTGATVSIISSKQFEVWDPKTRPQLRGTDVQLLTADSTEIQLLGTVSAMVTFGFRAVRHEFYVANIDTDFLLGLDFLDTQCCQLDLEACMLTWGTEKIPLRNTRRVEMSRRVVNKVTVLVPPYTELMVEGTLVGAKGTVGLGVIEPSERFKARFPVLMAPSIPQGVGEPIYVQLWNPGEETVVIYANTNMGIWTPVTAVRPLSSEAVDESAWTPVVRTIHAKQAELDGIKVDDVVNLEVPEHLQVLWESSQEGLEEAEKEQLKVLLVEYQDLFMKPGEILPGTDMIYHTIETGDAQPIRQGARRVPIHQKTELETELHKMVEEGILEPGYGPWASPLVLVRKKDGSLRCCVSYQKLNDVTRKDAYPIPRIDDTLDMLSGSLYFSTLDLASGYYQVKMDPKDKEKTAVATHIGLFNFLRMPFGLCNAPSTFERLMERVLRGLQWHQCLLYLDDVIIYSVSFLDHVTQIRNVFDRFREAGLRMKAKKCSLFQTSVEYLGHVVGQDGVSTTEDKVEKVRDWPTPTTPTEVRQFVGLTSYYRRFMKDYAKKAKPLHRLTEKDREFIWTEECENSFRLLKQTLVTAPVLAYPDPTLSFILDVDACNVGLGGVL